MRALGTGRRVKSPATAAPAYGVATPTRWAWVPGGKPEQSRRHRKRWSHDRRGAGLGIERVQPGQELGAQHFQIGVRLDGVGVQLDDRAAAGARPRGRLVLEVIVDRDVVEAAEAGRCRRTARAPGRRRDRATAATPRTAGSAAGPARARSTRRRATGPASRRPGAAGRARSRPGPARRRRRPPRRRRARPASRRRCARPRPRRRRGARRRRARSGSRPAAARTRPTSGAAQMSKISPSRLATKYQWNIMSSSAADSSSSALKKEWAKTSNSMRRARSGKPSESR